MRQNCGSCGIDSRCDAGIHGDSGHYPNADAPWRHLSSYIEYLI